MKKLTFSLMMAALCAMPVVAGAETSAAVPAQSATARPDANITKPEIKGAYSFATATAQKNGAAFMVITFPAGAVTEGETLVSVSGDGSESIELHTHAMEGGVMKMRKAEQGFAVKDGTIALQPAGDHIMLMGLKAPLLKGETLALTLHFKNAGDVAVIVPVLGAGEQPDAAAQAMDDDHDAHGGHATHDAHGAHNAEGHDDAGHSHH